MIRNRLRARRAARLAAGTIEPGFATIAARVAPFTMTSTERIAALCRAVGHCIDRDVPGALVECGVWRGGSAMAMALSLRERGAERDIVLFDTFTGMTAPEAIDVDLDGRPASEQWTEGWLGVQLDEVRANLRSIGCTEGPIALVEGPVERTLPTHAPEAIALLRLDTDWHGSTLHELTHLYPRLSSGGVLIIDDYGHWSGARTAVDAYFATLDDPPRLHAIDYTGRLCIKP